MAYLSRKSTRGLSSSTLGVSCLLGAFLGIASCSSSPRKAAHPSKIQPMHDPKQVKIFKISCLVSGLYPEKPKTGHKPHTPVYLGKSLDIAAPATWLKNLPAEDSDDSLHARLEEKGRGFWSLSLKKSFFSSEDGQEKSLAYILELVDPTGEVALSYESSELPETFNISQNNTGSALHLQCSKS